MPQVVCCEAKKLQRNGRAKPAEGRPVGTCFERLLRTAGCDRVVEKAFSDVGARRRKPKSPCRIDGLVAWKETRRAAPTGCARRTSGRIRWTLSGLAVRARRTLLRIGWPLALSLATLSIGAGRALRSILWTLSLLTVGTRGASWTLCQRGCYARGANHDGYGKRSKVSHLALSPV